MKRLIFTLIVLALMATPAVAVPTLGWWDSEHPRATSQSWDFSNAEQDGGVLTIKLDRPKVNAFNLPMVDA